MKMDIFDMSGSQMASDVMIDIVKVVTKGVYMNGRWSTKSIEKNKIENTARIIFKS
jgi:hypothetical protein